MVDENINEILKDFSTTLNTLSTALASTDNFNIEDKYETITVRYVDNSWYNPGGVWGDEYSSESERVKVGDNKQEIIANFKANRLESYMGVANENYSAIEEQFFTPLLDISKEISESIDNLESSVVKFKNELK